MKRVLDARLWSGAIGLLLAARFTGCQGAPTRGAADLRRLQGHWEGEGREGNGPKRPCSITITGNSLRLYRDTNYWFETTFTLPPGTEPQEIQATIRAASHRDHVGEVVFGILKLEGGVLTLAALDSPGELPKDFADEQYSLYQVRKTARGEVPKTPPAAADVAP